MFSRSLFGLATLLFPAILLFTPGDTEAQNGFDKDRKSANITSTPERRIRTQQRNQQTHIFDPPKLPFQQSLIIYYKVPGKTAAATDSANKDASAAQTKSVINGEHEPKRKTENAASERKQGSNFFLSPRRTEALNILQPVLISYRAYSPAEFVKAPPTDSKPSRTAKFVPGTDAPVGPSLKENAMAPAPASKFAAEALGSGTSVESRDLTGGTVKSEERQKVFNRINESFPTLSAKPDGEPIMSLIPRSVPDRPISPFSAGTSAATEEKAAIQDDAMTKSTAAAANSINESPLSPSPVRVSTELKAASGADLASSAVDVAPTKPASSTETYSAAREKTYMHAKIAELNNSAVQLTLDADYSKAETLLKQAIEAQPAIAAFHRNLSVLYGKMNKIDEALDSARTAAKLAPADPLVLDQLCVLELATGDAATAAGCYEKLKSIEPLDALAETLYGTALFRSGKVDESAPILEKAAQSQPVIPEALNAVGVLYYKKKRFAEAVAALKNAVEIAPEIYEIRYNLAIAQLALKNKAGAVSQYNILKTGDPKLAEQLARVLYADKLVFVSDAETKK